MIIICKCSVWNLFFYKFLFSPWNAFFKMVFWTFDYDIPLLWHSAHYSPSLTHSALTVFVTLINSIKIVACFPCERTVLSKKLQNWCPSSPKYASIALWLQTIPHIKFSIVYIYISFKTSRQLRSRLTGFEVGQPASKPAGGCESDLNIYIYINS